MLLKNYRGLGYISHHLPIILALYYLYEHEPNGLALIKYLDVFTINSNAAGAQRCVSYNGGMCLWSSAHLEIKFQSRMAEHENKWTLLTVNLKYLDISACNSVDQLCAALVMSSYFRRIYITNSVNISVTVRSKVIAQLTTVIKMLRNILFLSTSSSPRPSFPTLLLRSKSQYPRLFYANVMNWSYTKAQAYQNSFRNGNLSLNTLTRD